MSLLADLFKVGWGPRGAKRGFSLLEALIMLAISTLAALIILPSLGLNARRSLTFADTTVSNARFVEAIVEVEALLATGVAVGRDDRARFIGDARSLKFLSDGDSRLPCAEVDGIVSISVEAAGASSRLLCANMAQGSTRELYKTQPGGEMWFSFVGGAEARKSWSARAIGDPTPTAVLLTLSDGGKTHVQVVRYAQDAPSLKNETVEAPSRTFP